MGVIKSIDSKITYVCEKQEWAIYREGKSIANHINSLTKAHDMIVTHKVHLVKSQIIHFGSQYMWEIWRDLIPPESKVIVNFYHGKHEDGPDVAKHIEDFIINHKRISVILVANSIIYERLIDWGIPKNKIQKIFIGVDTKLFFKRNYHKKLIARQELGIPQDAFVVGSFQKDGIGWKSGNQPKYIKGPDIFVEVLDIISRTNKVTVLLTGPSRGYIKTRLKNLGIDYKHFRVDEYPSMPVFYHALDLYLITSREEGGPKGLVESIASGISVVSTPVGMAYDLLDKYRIFSDFDSKKIAIQLNEMIRTKSLLTQIKNENQVIDKIDYSQTAKEHLKVYTQLLNS
jgi:glycosyltransferase involved in cell wall biosynthesis